MEAASTVVIKVKYGDVLRRFDAQIIDGEFNLTLDGLREKICSLFSFAPDTDLMLTYTDEDGDLVNLIDRVDLSDVAKQGLDPLRITVKTIPSRPPQQQQTLQNLQQGVSEMLKTVPFMNISNDLMSKASTSTPPGIIEFLDSLSKVGLSYLSTQHSESQTREQSAAKSDVSECSQAKTVMSSLKESKDACSSENSCVDKKDKGKKISECYANGSTFSPRPVFNTTDFLLPPPPPPFGRTSSRYSGGTRITSHSNSICNRCGINPVKFREKVKLLQCHKCLIESRIANNSIVHDMMMAHIKAKSRAYDEEKLDSCFIVDVNVRDGTIMAPSTPFTKIWRMRNTGTVAWPQETKFVWMSGDRLSSRSYVELKIPRAGLMVDQEIDIAVDFLSPELPGFYKSHWRLHSPTGYKFGQSVWAFIEVDDSIKTKPCKTFCGWNLNFIPEAEAEAVVEEPNNSKKTVEVVEPVVDVQPNDAPEMKFLTDDNAAGRSVPLPTVESLGPLPPVLIAASQESALELPGENAGNAVSDPVIRMLDPPPLSEAISSLQDSCAENREKEVEEKLLKELEEMGFRYCDLNKEVLRMNKYDLEQSVDYLSGIADWDVIFEELQEMGFHDTNMNKHHVVGEE